MNGNMKVYDLKSVFDDVSYCNDSFDEVPFYWYAQDRKQPIGKYEDLIVGYNDLSEDERDIAQQWLDERFTEQEIAVIKPIIEEISYNCELREIPVPTVVRKDGRLCVVAFKYMAKGRRDLFQCLNSEEHNLPFDVVCYFDVRAGISNKSKRYTAYSVIDNVKGRLLVPVNWAKMNTKLDEADYREIIKDYDHLSAEEKSKAEAWASQLFTEDEISILRLFLRKRFRAGLLEQKHFLPIEAKDVAFEGEEVSNTIELRKYDKRQDLPFEVCGHYNLGLGLQSDELVRQIREDGLEFLAKGFKILFPKLEWPDKLREEAIEEIYNKYGLYVSRTLCAD